jgi:hypothetical protein
VTVAVCRHVEHLSSLAAEFVSTVHSCAGLAVAFADVLLVVVAAAVLASAAEKCLLRLLRWWQIMPTRIIYMIPTAAYHAYHSVPGDDGCYTASVPGRAPSECSGGDTSPSTKTAAAAGTESCGHSAQSTLNRQRVKCDGGAVIWRDSLPTSTIADGQRSQFSETKV